MSVSEEGEGRLATKPRPGCSPEVNVSAHVWPVLISLCPPGSCQSHGVLSAASFCASVIFTTTLEIIRSRVNVVLVLYVLVSLLILLGHLI